MPFLPQPLNTCTSDALYILINLHSNKIYSYSRSGWGCDFLTAQDLPWDPEQCTAFNCALIEV